MRNGSRNEARNHAHAFDIAGAEPPRLAQHAPRPFQPGFARDGRCAALCAGDEIECGPDAQHAGSVQLVEASRREQFLPWRAQCDEAEPGARGTNAFDRSIGFAGIGIEPRSWCKATRDLQSPESFRQTPRRLMQREIVRAQQKDREAFLSRLRADRFDEIGAGRPLDPRSHETAQHDDREPVGCDKSGTAIGGAKVCVLLQLNNVIQVERADAEVVAMLRGRHDRRDGFRKRGNIDGDAMDSEARLQRYWRFRHVIP